MPTNRKRIARRLARRPLLDFVRIYLMDGPVARSKAMTDQLPGTGKADAFNMLIHGKTMSGEKYNYRDAWNEHKKEILRIWKAEKRRGKPWGAKEFD